MKKNNEIEVTKCLNGMIPLNDYLMLKEVAYIRKVGLSWILREAVNFYLKNEITKGTIKIKEAKVTF